MVAWILVILCIVRGRRFLLKRKGRRTPLTRNLLRSPGESLRTRIDELTEDTIGYLLFLVFALFIVYSIHISHSYFGEIPESPSRIAVSVLLCLGFLVFFTYKLVRTMNLRQRLRLAHDAEMEVGQELKVLEAPKLLG
jgi:uncharacterized integral membrane protein